MRSPGTPAFAPLWCYERHQSVMPNDRNFEYTKALSSTFNDDTQEVAADPIQHLYVLDQAIRRAVPDHQEKTRLGLIKEWRAPKYAEFIGNEIRFAGSSTGKSGSTRPADRR